MTGYSREARGAGSGLGQTNYNRLPRDGHQQVFLRFLALISVDLNSKSSVYQLFKRGGFAGKFVWERFVHLRSKTYSALIELRWWQKLASLITILYGLMLISQAFVDSFKPS